MPSHTINLGKEEVTIVKVVQAVNELDNIDQAISFIVKDYADTESYSKFIKSHRKKK